MVYYLLRRLVGAVAVLFGVVTGTFVLSHVVPSALLGVGLGLVWAWRGNRPESWLIRPFSMLGTAMPVFWFAMVLQLWLASRLGWFPITGRNEIDPPSTITGFHTVDALFTGNLPAFADAAWHLVLPVTALVMWQFAIAARLTQKSVLEEMRMPYVRTAIAKGAGTRRVLLGHVFRNAINPVITMLGLQFGWLLG